MLQLELEMSVNICDSLQRETFLRKLGACEYAAASRGDFDEWEQKFIRDMRERYNTREDNTDFGLSPWSPTRKQWNLLGELYERVRV